MRPEVVQKAAIRQVASMLNPIADVVFVGGATVALYVTTINAPEVRPTKDVDVLVEITTYPAFASLEEKLRSIGFQNDHSSSVICRYRMQGLIVDIMPTSNILGFTNRWYADGFRTAMPYDLDGLPVKILSPPYWIATKLEAFKNRGKNDGRTSHDFEDIVYVLNNRPGIWDECHHAPTDLRTALQDTFKALLKNRLFLNG